MPRMLTGLHKQIRLLHGANVFRHYLEKIPLNQGNSLGVANHVTFMGPKAMAKLLSCWLWLAPSSVTAITSSTSPTNAQYSVHRCLNSETPSCSPLQILLLPSITYVFTTMKLSALANACAQYRQGVGPLRFVVDQIDALKPELAVDDTDEINFILELRADLALLIGFVTS